MTILEDYLERNARLYPQKTAVVCGEKSCTYEALCEQVLTRAKELKNQYQTGQIVCLRAYPTIEYLVEYFALHRAGCVAAPLERDMPEMTFQDIARRLGAHPTPEGTADILYTTGTT